ncbi:MAG: hypothetical protein C0475_07215 [Planctomyces sp.]|nr:hypothetical protein [Planctomyces sp.]MBA4119705.1 hypothetical protein [Isosphaera sp.]
MLRRVSLANKCLLLFGAALVLIIGLGLLVPWVKMLTMVDEGELEVARQAVRLWEAENGGALPAIGSAVSLGSGVDLRVVGPEVAAEGGFAARAWAELSGAGRVDEVREVGRGVSDREYRYALAVRAGPAGAGAGAGGGAGGGTPAGELIAAAVAIRKSPGAARQVVLNTVYLISAGLVTLGLAVLVFYLITNRIIFQPVRALTETAERVREGGLASRSDIHTGDEFEELAEAFNEMVSGLAAQQEQLRAVNASLDSKLSELAERNTALYQAAKLKGEFLASVTHELRTPLNSILGFAELLEEQAGREVEAGDDSSRLSKRRRYVENILGSARSLMDLINGILEMAKAEAGKLEIQARRVDVRQACEQMVAMMRPMADKRGVELRLECPERLPELETDPGKLQQVLFNLMSNAVKFTGDAADSEREVADRGEEITVRPALVILRAEHLIPRSGAGPEGTDRLRLSVLDTGPGIAPEDRDRIFEKFTQLDTGHARRHAGTGLGLAITKELTMLLQAEIFVHSELGRGSMFSVVLPLRMDPSRRAETRAEQGFRAALAAQR